MKTAAQVLMESFLLNVLESHQNKPFDIRVLLEGKISIEMQVSSRYSHVRRLAGVRSRGSSLQLSRPFLKMKYLT